MHLFDCRKVLYCSYCVYHCNGSDQYFFSTTPIFPLNYQNITHIHMKKITQALTIKAQSVYTTDYRDKINYTHTDDDATP